MLILYVQDKMLKHLYMEGVCFMTIFTIEIDIDL